MFIGSNNRVIARDAATGADLCQHQSPDASRIPQNATPSAPAVAGDTLYIGFPNGRVTALTSPWEPSCGACASPARRTWAASCRRRR